MEEKETKQVESNEYQIVLTDSLNDDDKYIIKRRAEQCQNMYLN